ncbi:MAG: Zinc phosphodiesterase ELAC protein 2 [Alyxoria varia]|nr:MAG: Zinc phosphodiesterase ELAC protein 2 [Alyxoria varia]
MHCNLSEGSSRACLQQRVGLRKANELLLTGLTRWQNIGGMLGMVLGLADMKKSAAEALLAKEKSRPNRDSKFSSRKPNANSSASLRFHGGPNLNYAVATARRFIFRTGIPMRIEEHAADTTSTPSDDKCEPTWSDQSVLVWALPILPDDSRSSRPSTVPMNGRKRSFEEANEQELFSPEELGETLPKKIVKQMFDSDWRMDRLSTKPLRDVQLPATVFVRDPTNGALVRYNGPMPEGDAPVPDIDVFVRQPWPGALTESLPPTKPSSEAISYIIRNHPQRGKFMPQKANELEVFPKSLWSGLAAGKVVQNIHGRDITPDMVLQPGKQGGGFVVADIPTVDYIANFKSRPEWQRQEVMDGVGAFIWILGPGVIHDKRLIQFQEGFSNFKHIFSCVEAQANDLALEIPARSAWRHRCVDNHVFPPLTTESKHLGHSDTPVPLPDIDGAVPAQPGLILELEPKIQLSTKNVKTAPDIEGLENACDEEVRSVIGEENLNLSYDNEVDGEEWARRVPHGNAEIVTLGTGSSHPSTHRNVSATLVRAPNCGSYLFDCGEGTLGSLRRMYTKPELDEIFRDLRMVWISHMHADHHLGLTSLINAWYSSVHHRRPADGDEPNLVPENLQDRKLGVVSDAPMLQWLQEYSSVEDFGFSRILPLATQPSHCFGSTGDFTPTRLRLTLFGTSENTDNSDDSSDATAKFLEYMGLSSLSTVLVNHCRGAQAISIRACSGLKVSYSGDCRPSAKFADIGQDSDVLIHEATFEDTMRTEAFAKKHSTAGEALIVAMKMKAKACVLTHFSQRYPSMPPLGAPKGDLEVEAAESNLEGVLEDDFKLDEQVDAAETDEQPTVDTQKSSDDVTFARGNNKDLSTEYASLIDEGNLSHLLASSNVKVVMAFDYMRLPIWAIPRIEKKQQLLRTLYEKLQEKEDAQSLTSLAEDRQGQAGDGEGNNKDGGGMSVRKRKKMEKKKQVKGEQAT